jgi:site-specific recombinase XerD
MGHLPAVPEPLQALEEGFRDKLVGLGYATRVSDTHLCLMRHLSRWLGTRGLGAGDLTGDVVSAFVAERRAAYSSLYSARALNPLLGYLRQRELAPSAMLATPSTTAAILLKRFEDYLTTERGLAPKTVKRYLSQVTPFLAVYSERLASLSEREVSAFVTKRASAVSSRSLNVEVGALRALLRWLWRERIVPGSLAESTGSVAFTRTSLPSALSPTEVKSLFAALSVKGNARLRDEAMFNSMLRLGLRAGEVANLSFDDIDWRRGLVVVHGKGSRRDQLPLPVDVGRSLVTYLKNGRPKAVAHRQLFLALDAPHGPLGSTAVTNVVVRAMARAGISGPGAAHRLRHTAACRVLAQGGGLVEVGQLLRHSSPTDTALYAKSDLVAMATLARPWITEVSR